MKRLILLLFSVLIRSGVFAQQTDSMTTRILEEVVVMGVKTEGDSLQSFYKSNGSATTENIVSRMAGISLIRRGAFGQEPVIRGLSGGQLNVTIDGMKVFGACTDKMDPATIYVEPLNLSVIQALPGVQGAEFGSTIGGTLNMKLAEPRVGSPRITGRMGADVQSSARALNYFSAVNISRATSGYRANVTYRKSGNYHAGGGAEVPYSQFEKVNIALAAKYTLGEYDTLQADVLWDRGWNIGFPALPMDVGQASAGIYSITYQRVARWLFFNTLRAKAYHNAITHSMDDTHRSQVAMHMDMPGSSRTSGTFMEGDIHLFHEHRTFMKLEYYSNRLLGEMTMYPSDGVPMYMQTAPLARRQNAGIYIQQQFRLEGNSRLSLSVRGDVVRDFLHDGVGRQQWTVIDPGLATSSARFLKTFRASYRRNLGQSMQLELRGGYGERIPTLNERYGFYLFNRMDGYDYLGRPALKNETSWDVDIMFSYFRSKVELQVVPFYKIIDDYIFGSILQDYSAMTIGAKGVKQHMNLTWARMAGVDVMILSNPVPALQWITNLKYTYGYTSLRESMPLMPPLKVVISLRYGWKKVHVQGELEWSAAQHRVSRSFGEKQTGSYAVVNLRTGWSVNTTWQLNGGVENILDQNYREHLDWGGIPRPGRNIYMNMTFKF